MVEPIPGCELQALRLRGTSEAAERRRLRLTLAISFALAAHASIAVLISAAVRRSALPDAPAPPVMEMVFAPAASPAGNDQAVDQAPVEAASPAVSPPPAEPSLPAESPPPAEPPAAAESPSPESPPTPPVPAPEAPPTPAAAAEPPKPEPLPVPTSPPAALAEKRPTPPPQPAPHPHPASPRPAHLNANATKLEAANQPETPAANPAPAPTAAAAAPSGGPIAPALTAISPGWRSELAAWLNAHKTYPEAARILREEGSAGVRFTVERDGRLLDFVLVHGTGSDRLDQAVRDLLRDARLPPFPPEMPEEKLTVTVQIHFSLQH